MTSYRDAARKHVKAAMRSTIFVCLASFYTHNIHSRTESYHHRIMEAYKDK